MAQWTKPSDDELRALLGIPFGLTRSLRDPRQLRSPRHAELDGRQAWRFDVALNHTYFAADHESVANNYSAGVVATACRIDGRVALGLARAIERLYDPSPNEELVRQL